MNRLKELREAHGWSIDDIVRETGIKRTTYYNYEAEGRKLTSETLIFFADFYNVSIDYLLYRDEKVVQIKPPLVQKYEKLDEHGKKIVDVVLDVEANRAKEDTFISAPKKIIPLFPAAAGPGEPIEGNAFDEYETDNESADFAVRISGDSMEPHFHDGDIVLCRREEVQTGDIAVVMVNGLLLVKQFIAGYAGHWYLRSLNRDLANLDYDFFPSGNDTINLFGVVIHKRIPLVQQ